MFPDTCSDAVVLQINSDASALTYSTYLGQADISEFGNTIAVDSSHNAYVAGVAGGAGFVAKIIPVTGSQPTAITLTSSSNPSNQGQSVTFTATVTPPEAPGQVSFRDGNTVLGLASLNTSGAATFTPNSLSGGSHSISAEYPGDANFAPSTSAALTQVVSGISLATTKASATVAKGGTASFPLTVTQACSG